MARIARYSATLQSRQVECLLLLDQPDLGDIGSPPDSAAPGLAGEAQFQSAVFGRLRGESTGRLLTAADDGSVNIRSMESGELLSRVRVSSVRTSAFAVSRDGVYVSAGGPGFGIRELEVAAGNVREVLTESNLTFSSLCYSPVGHLLAWARPDGTVDLLDLSVEAERRLTPPFCYRIKYHRTAVPTATIVSHKR